jgi:hypothetical protein
MKKIALAAVIALASGVVAAADFANLDIDHVRDMKNNNMSNAHYLRVGKEVSGFQLGAQARTQVWNEGGMGNSIEVTAGKAIGAVTPFVGVGFDNGYNGVKNADYQYGLVGATTGMKVGPGFALAGLKTRVGTTAGTETKQTVAFGTYSIPVSKGVDIRLNVSKSYQDIRENAYGVGVGFSF